MGVYYCSYQKVRITGALSSECIETISMHISKKMYNKKSLYWSAIPFVTVLCKLYQTFSMFKSFFSKYHVTPPALICGHSRRI